MSEQTPSQAEGEREPDTGTTDPAPVPDSSGAPRTTPSQAEGDRSQDEETGPASGGGD